MYNRPIVVAVVSAHLACGADGRPNPVKDAFAATSIPDGHTPSVLFRFPTDGGGIARLYQLPDLEEAAWHFETGEVAIREAVGFSADEDLVYSLSANSELVALDLTSGRAHVIDTNVALAALGPTGVLHLVRRDSSVASIERRRIAEWTVRFPAIPTRIWGVARGRLLAETHDEAGRLLQLVSDGQTVATHRIPAGPISVAVWGDAAAVVTDTGVLVLHPPSSDTVQFLQLIGAEAVAISPSAHRLYATDRSGTLYNVERFDMIALDSLALPEPVSDIRLDPVGRFLIAKSRDGDTVWIVDLMGWTVAGSVRASWDSDLPTIAKNGSLLFRRDDEIVATSLNQLDAEASTSGGSDRFLPAVWDPRRPALQVVADDTPSEEEESADQLIYAQVSSTHNPDWATEHAQNLRRAGLDATVLPPRQGDELYRVVLGPYDTRAEAEQAAQQLGLPFWIFTDTVVTDSTRRR